MRGFSKWKKENLIVLIPPFIAGAIILAVYAVKGIYPFGTLMVGYGDMDQHYIPFSYHIYDVIHSGKSLFWDPFLGTGSNIFGLEALSGMFSPISWLVVLTRRENIPFFMSWLLMLRMMLLSFTSCIFMNRVFRETPAFWRVSLSVMYAFCGYVLIFYTNMAWVDCAILFPLLLLSLKDLYENGRTLRYLCVLSAHLIVSYYISFMALLFVFFSSGAILLFCAEKGKRKAAVLRLGAGTAGALLLTSFVTVPAFLQSTGSGRYNPFSYLKVLGSTADGTVTWNKLDFFFFAAVMLVILLKILIDARRNRKMTFLFLSLLGFTVSQVFVESVNLLWYGGSYVCYPLRFGYMPLFLLLSGCAWYFSPGFVKKVDKNPTAATFPDDPAKRADGRNADSAKLAVGWDTDPSKREDSCFDENRADSTPAAQNIEIPPLRHVGIDETPKSAEQFGRIRRPNRRALLTLLRIFIIPAVSLAAFAAAVWIGKTFLDGAVGTSLYGYWGIDAKSSMLFGASALLFGLTIWGILAMKNRKIRYILLTVVFFTEIFTHCLWYVGITPRGDGHVDDWTSLANDLYEDTVSERADDSIVRWKDADSVMNANYPLVMGVQSISSYLHLIGAEQQEAFDRLGYSTNYTRILDTGGTLFSDMVLGVDYFLTETPYDPEVYELLGKSGDFYRYKCRYSLPDGLVISANGAVPGALQMNVSPVVNQNLVYRTLFGASGDLIDQAQEEPELSAVRLERGTNSLAFILEDSSVTGKVTYTIPVSEKSFLYLSASSISGAFQIFVNGSAVVVPTFGNNHNVWFPASYNNGVLNLGLYENETVTVKFVMNDNVYFNSFALGKLPVDSLAALSEQFEALSSQPASSHCDKVSIAGGVIRAKAYAAQEGQALFLPLNWDAGWECSVNGKTVGTDKIFGTFLLLDLEKGENMVVLRFFPKGMKPCAAVSVIALFLIILATALARWLRKKNMANEATWLLQRGRYGKAISCSLASAVHVLYWAVYFLAIAFFYLVPILFLIIKSVFHGFS